MKFLLVQALLSSPRVRTMLKSLYDSSSLNIQQWLATWFVGPWLKCRRCQQRGAVRRFHELEGWRWQCRTCHSVRRKIA